MFKIKYIMIGSILFCLNVYSFTSFPTSYYPTQDHPRLWLTAERVAAFQMAQQQNTERWQAFKGLCDSLIDADPTNDPYPYPTDEPQRYTAPLALMYQLTDDSRYADRAMDLIEDTNATDIIHDGDAYQRAFDYLGLAYDWLYGYVGMTEVKKQEYRNKMVTVGNTMWNQFNTPVTALAADSDANLLTGATYLTLGAAMYGETSDAVTFLDRGWTGWDEGYYGVGDTDSHTPKRPNKELIELAVGGQYYTGMSYFSSTDLTGISALWMTLSTACNYDVAGVDPQLEPFWANTIRSLIYATNPSREHIIHNGAWEDQNRLNSLAYFQRMMITLTYFANQVGDITEAALARGYRDVGNSEYNDPFLEFFYITSDATVTSPYNANLPLIHFSDEPDFLFFRDSWDTSAKWGAFYGNGSLPVDHQSPDHGSFDLWYGNDYLTKGVRTYDGLARGFLFNTLSIETPCDFRQDCAGSAYFNSEQRASIARYREEDASPLFAYAMLDADGQWNDHPQYYQAWDNVNSYRRHFFWAGDYVVVFDRVRTKIAGWVTYRLRALTEPLINGSTVTQLSPNGSQKLLQQTLEPANVTVDVIDESVVWSYLDTDAAPLSERKWQSVIELPAATEHNILNVIQMGESTMQDFSTLEHISSKNNSGVRIGNWAVLFSSEENLRTAVTYTVEDNSAGMWHLVADMKPGTYEVREGNTKTATAVVLPIDGNTILFQSKAVTQNNPISISLKKSDILWRNNTTGMNYLYLMNGSTITSEGVINTVDDPNWKIVGVSDFNGDCQADILWRNSTTGMNYLYLMNGNTIIGEGVINTVDDLSWQIASVADFNADGKADILWRNSATGMNYLYTMDGSTITSQRVINTVADQNWQMESTKDYNGDGKADILWRNTTTGMNYLYTMDGSTITSQGIINTVADQSWKIAGTADFSGDGKADILWRNSATGMNYLYLMDGTSITSEGVINTVADQNWQIKGTGDYDGDGKADILWRNSDTGMNYLYRMNGTTIESQGIINTVSDMNWEIVH